MESLAGFRERTGTAPRGSRLGAGFAIPSYQAQAVKNEDQVRQAVEEMPFSSFLLGFRTYPQQARLPEQFRLPRSARHDSCGLCRFAKQAGED